MKRAVYLCGLCMLLLAGHLSCRSETDTEPSTEARASMAPAASGDATAMEAPSPEGLTDAPGRKVWICHSTGAKRYHYDKDCQGLRRCTHTILETTVKDAERVGLTECRYED